MTMELEQAQGLSAMHSTQCKIIGDTNDDNNDNDNDRNEDNEDNDNNDDDVGIGTKTMELEQALGLSAMHSTQCKFEQSCRHLKPIGNTSRNYSLMRMKMRRLRI